VVVVASDFYKEKVQEKAIYSKYLCMYLHIQLCRCCVVLWEPEQMRKDSVSFALTCISSKRILLVHLVRHCLSSRWGVKIVAFMLRKGKVDNEPLY